LPDPAAQLRGTALRGTLTLLLMFDTDAISINDRRVPLEYRPTAAFAQGLQDSNIWSQEFRSFLLGDLLDALPSHPIALVPHRRGRMRVVLVHGTASGAGRWAGLANDLISAPGWRRTTSSDSSPMPPVTRLLTRPSACARR
jgi:hypothetical protein